MPEEPTQPTQPKKGDPVEIPVPTRGQVFGDLAKAAQPARKRKAKRSRQRNGSAGK